MALKNPGPKPRRFKSRPYIPNRGYWWAWIAGQSRSLCRWMETDLATLDRIFADKQAHYEALKQRQAEEVDTSLVLSTLEKDTLCVKNLIGMYLAARIKHVDHQDPGKRLGRTTFSGYERTLRWVGEQIGDLPIKALGPMVFTALIQKAEIKYGVKQTNHIVSTTRMMFHWATQNALLPAQPAYGSEFVSTNERLRVDTIRQKPMKLFTAAQIRMLLAKADKNMRAMIYLGINCAYLQSDCAELLINFGDHLTAELNLGRDPFIRFDRVKTGERRKATLWPETVKALKAVIGDRCEGQVFVTRKGFPIIHQTAVTDGTGNVLRYANCDGTVKKFRDLCVRAGLRSADATEDDPMYGLGFSSLRTTFETVAFTCRDLSVAHQAAIAWIMGHRLSGVNLSKMADRYLQDIDTATLALVTDHVRRWLLKKG